jgi:hypothetical protein
MADIGFLNNSDSEWKFTMPNFDRYIKIRWMKKPNKAT